MPNYLPLSHFSKLEIDVIERGKSLIGQAKVAGIAMAGGHGSRLGFDAPKGCYPLTVVTKKSLYQLLAERTQAASKTYKQDLQLAIMTSDATHNLTVQHFEENNFFGLKKEQICFFKQDNLPLQDLAGNELVSFAPNGNGTLFWNLAKSGILQRWQNSGIEQIVVHNIDNALAEPFEPGLIGLNALHKNEATLVGVKRASAEEQVGVLVEKEKKLAVIEYSEMEDEERKALDKYPLANISYFAFSLEFIKRVVAKPYSLLPLHRAKKQVRLNNGPEWVIKSEYFIFDLLAFAERSEVLFLDREEYFAPLKNHAGPQSVATVQKQLEAFDRRKYFKLTGSRPPENQPFELSPLYGII